MRKWIMIGALAALGACSTPRTNPNRSAATMAATCLGTHNVLCRQQYAV